LQLGSNSLETKMKPSGNPPVLLRVHENPRSAVPSVRAVASQMLSHSRGQILSRSDIKLGHLSQKMLQHYSHVRQEAKREAVNVLSAKRPNRPTIKGYDTKNDTNPVSPE